MKKIYPVIVCLLFLLAIHACTKNKETMPPPPEPLKVAGMVVDSTNQGLGEVKIFFTANSFVLTNAAGNFQLTLPTSGATLTPVKEGFTFTPAFAKITTSVSNLVFRAKKIQMPIDEGRVKPVYDWFTSIQLPNGLLESAENSNVVSLYDQALAAMVFMAKGDINRAEAVFDFFNGRMNTEFNTGYGGFMQFRDRTGNTGITSGGRWMGDNAWLLIALNNYKAKTNSSRYQAMSLALETWLRSLQAPDGGLADSYNNNGNLNSGRVTEGMIDAFNAVPGYDPFHKNLLTYLKNNRWDVNDKLLISWPGNYYYYAMDNHSWGYCGFEDYPKTALQKADRYLNTQRATVNGQSITGYCFDIDKDNIWLEGTGQMVVAFQKAGDTLAANTYLKEMEKLLVPGSIFSATRGLPYASNKTTHYGTAALWTGSDTNPCISSGAWYLYGLLGFDPLLVGYRKNIPLTDKFWMN